MREQAPGWLPRSSSVHGACSWLDSTVLVDGSVFLRRERSDGVQMLGGIDDFWVGYVFHRHPVPQPFHPVAPRFSEFFRSRRVEDIASGHSNAREVSGRRGRYSGRSGLTTVVYSQNRGRPVPELRGRKIEWWRCVCGGGESTPRTMTGGSRVRRRAGGAAALSPCHWRRPQV